ncbi:MAG: hypothetical protein EB084_04775 [Proteobacteria bacterium]|nr:hypothetical protein [Pseudomonadota bacterium]
MEAPDTSPTAAGAAPSASPPVDKNALREKVRELATVSGDLEMLTRQLARPQSTVQVNLLHERMEQLTRQQRSLVQHIAAQCPDAERRTQFEGLDKRLQSLRAEVQETRDPAVLEQHRAEIDPLVDAWARVFEDMVVHTLQG